MNEFMECDTCKKKPGMPVLCDGCLNNRRVIAELDDKLKTYKEAIKCICGIVEILQRN